MTTYHPVRLTNEAKRAKEQEAFKRSTGRSRATYALPTHGLFLYANGALTIFPIEEVPMTLVPEIVAHGISTDNGVTWYGAYVNYSPIGDARACYAEMRNLTTEQFMEKVVPLVEQATAYKARLDTDREFALAEAKTVLDSTADMSDDHRVWAGNERVRRIVADLEGAV